MKLSKRFRRAVGVIAALAPVAVLAYMLYAARILWPFLEALGSFAGILAAIIVWAALVEWLLA